MQNININDNTNAYGIRTLTCAYDGCSVTAMVVEQGNIISWAKVDEPDGAIYFGDNDTCPALFAMSFLADSVIKYEHSVNSVDVANLLQMCDAMDTYIAGM